MNAHHVLGIDAGGTKIHFRLADETGTTIRDLILPSENWAESTAEDKAAQLSSAIDLHIAAPLDSVAVGAHGCDTDEDCADLAAQLEQLLEVPVTVVNDAELLLHVTDSATIAIIAGTGSIVLGRAADGGTLYAGGWGWLLGDEGSAWGIVRDAVKNLTIVADSDGADDPLEERMLALSKTANLREATAWMQRTPGNEWARWAPEFFAAADEGSAAARKAIEAGAEVLDGLVGDLLRRGALPGDVIVGGGVAVNQPRLVSALTTRLAQRGLALSLSTEAPVTGAVRLAVLQGSREGTAA